MKFITNTLAYQSHRKEKDYSRAKKGLFFFFFRDFKDFFVLFLAESVKEAYV